MTPDQHVAALRAYAERVGQLAHDRVEHVVRTEAVPTRPVPGISYVVTKTSTGVHLDVSGPGARRVAPGVVARLRTRAGQALAEAVRP